jgi:aspartokinase
MSIVSRARHHVTYASVIEGDISGAAKRLCERSLVEKLAEAHIVFDGLTVGNERCSFVVSERDGQRLDAALRDLNVAVQRREHCVRITITRNATDAPLPSMVRVLGVLDEECIDVVYLDVDATALTLLIDEADGDHLTRVIARFFQPRHASTHAGSNAFASA